ncbi:glycoside hydrolase family 79 protein [Amanita rubescens]|nr:glycoside hydrolase family 79 protein [Amanita rubescens]
MLPAAFLALALILYLATFARGQLDYIVLTSDPPSNALYLSPTLLSFSIEQDRWTNWSGIAARNTFFFNVLDNLRIKTGSPPYIRIGANSEDRTIFDPNVQFSATTFPPYTTTVPYPEANNISVGNGYYQTARFLPANTHVIWGVNLGRNNISAATLEAHSIFGVFSGEAFTDAGIILDAIEIGNEPDLYSHNGDRPSNYSVSDYVSEWSVFASFVSSVAQITNISQIKFWIGALAGSSHSTTGFSPQAILGSSILNSSLAGLISTYSQHHYSASFCQGAPSSLQDLMLKSNIRGNLSAFIPDIASVRANGFDYVLGETNSISCHGAPNVSNTAGATLWSLDYSLYAASIGVSRIFYHMGVGFRYTPIQPVTLTRSILDGSPLSQPLPPHVQPEYYAAIIIAEAIGSSGNVQMVEIQTDDPNVTGYAFYENETLARALFINSEAYFGGIRLSVHITINILGIPYSEMYVKRLAIGRADDTSGLTWGGQSYETQDGRVNGTEEAYVLPISQGVYIQETEAVMLRFV